MQSTRPLLPRPAALPALLLLCLTLCLAGTTRSRADAAGAVHHLVIHVDRSDAETMRIALGNATNTIEYYRQAGGSVAIEIVANGPGVIMLIRKESPVESDLAAFHARYPYVVLSACAHSLHALEDIHGHALPLVTGAHTVPSGAVRILELEEQHWAYLKP